jgi:hypothetical protein
LKSLISSMKRSLESIKNRRIKSQHLFQALQAALIGALAFSCIQAEAAQETQEPAKTICTMTINSENEKNIFKKHLGGKGKFKFVELVPGHADSITSNDTDDAEDWFNQACKAKIKCDVLLVSGHFAGSFFSNKSPYSLSLEALEQKACSNSCTGILQNPKAVYLFGCNTLAAKEKDRRTEKQYIEVLMRDGFSRDEAERLAQSRYGVFGDSFGARMQRVFHGEKIIYGFDSIGPAGSTIDRPLENYFLRTPNKSVRNFSDRVLKRSVDPEFMTALANSDITYVAGLESTDKEYQPSMQMCKMQLPQTTVEEKLKLANQFLNTEYRSLALPQVMSLFNNYRDLNPKRFSPAERLALAELTSNTPARQILVETSFKLNATPILQAQTFLWFYKVGWFSKLEFDTAQRGLIKKLVDNKSKANVESAAAIFQLAVQTKFDFHLPETFQFADPLSELDLQYLKTFNLSLEMREEILDLLAQERVEDKSWISPALVKTILGRRLPLPLTEQRKQYFVNKNLKFLDLFRLSYEGIEDLMREKLLVELSQLSGDALQRKICTQEAKTLFTGSMPLAVLRPLQVDSLQFLTAAQCVGIKGQLDAEADWLFPAVFSAFEEKRLTAYRAVDLLAGMRVPKVHATSPILKRMLLESKSSAFNEVMEAAVLEMLTQLSRAKNTKAMADLCEDYGKVVPGLFDRLQPSQFKIRLDLKDPKQYPLLSCFGLRQFDDWKTLVENYFNLKQADRIYTEEQMQKKVYPRFNLSLSSTFFSALSSYAQSVKTVKAVVSELRYTRSSDKFATWLVNFSENFEQLEKRLWFYQAVNVSSANKVQVHLEDLELRFYLLENWSQFDPSLRVRFTALLTLMSLSREDWQKFLFGHPWTDQVFNALDKESKLSVSLKLLGDNLNNTEKAFLLERLMAMSPDLAAQDQILANLPVSPENFKLLEPYREQFNFESKNVRQYFE